MSAEITPAALQLILDYECGGGRAYYEKRLARPTYPGGDSGPTIGIGYDLGYTPEARFISDWREELRSDQLDLLRTAIGLKRAAAKAAVRGLQSVVIPWHAALSVFTAHTLPFWMAETLRVYPHADELPGDAFGALVSIVFNRGGSLAGPTRREMRDLVTAVRAGDLRKMAALVRSMKRIWVGKGLPGLLRRREAEAKFS